MTTIVAKKLTESKVLTFLISLVFVLLPFQRRFHGCVDSWSRKLTLPDFPLPHFFSKKIHLFITDPIFIILSLILILRVKVPLRAFFLGRAFQVPDSSLFHRGSLALHFHLKSICSPIPAAPRILFRLSFF